jgi:hypothetical protein
VNAHDEKASTIDYLRRTAEATEATAWRVRVIEWVLVAAFVVIALPYFASFVGGYRAEQARLAEQANRPTRSIRP